MAFLRRDGDEGARRIVGAGVYLRHPEPRDYLPWAELRAESRDFLQPWEPTWAEDELDRASHRYKLRRYAEDIRDGRSYPFYVFRAEDGALVGGVTLSRVQRGVAQMCALGYWVGQRYARRGHTRAAVAAIVRHAFDELGMHRVEAACQPENAPSRSLLEQVGFAQEGVARAYLKIDGAWRDHLLFGIVHGDPVLPKGGGRS